jgi:hypothetical protein
MLKVYLSEAGRFASAAPSGDRIVRIAASAPNRRFLIYFLIFLGVGARGVFLGKSDQAVAQGRVGGIVGQTAAPLGLFSKIE